MLTVQDIDQRIFEHLKLFRSKFPNLSVDDVTWSDDTSQDTIECMYNSKNPDIPNFVFRTIYNSRNDIIKSAVKCI